MRVRPQRKNFQFTVISLSVNGTNSREHFHFCIKIRPDSKSLLNDRRRVRQTEHSREES